MNCSSWETQAFVCWLTWLDKKKTRIACEKYAFTMGSNEQALTSVLNTSSQRQGRVSGSCCFRTKAWHLKIICTLWQLLTLDLHPTHSIMHSALAAYISDALTWGGRAFALLAMSVGSENLPVNLAWWKRKWKSGNTLSQNKLAHWCLKCGRNNDSSFQGK